MAAAAASALLVACSGDSNDGDTATTEPAATASVSAAAASTSVGTPETTATVEDATPTGTFVTNTAEAGAATQVSANNALREELATAFDAAGISNSDRWAKEVEEYRPYPNDDPDMAKLRGELAKYNPSDGVVDAIVATLSLP